MRHFGFQQVLVLLLIVSMLSLTPTVTAYGQQPSQQDNTTNRNLSSQPDKQKAQQKLDLLAGARPLSDAEMDQIQGGAVLPVALAVAGLSLAAYNTWQNRRNAKKLYEACVAPKRAVRRR